MPDNMREKLIELLKEVVAIQECGFGDPRPTYETVASYLIANGVTVQKWIPVTERLPETDGIYIVRTVHGTLTTARFYAPKYFPATKHLTETHRSASWQAYRNVTHWMPLPEGPKEE